MTEKLDFYSEYASWQLEDPTNVNKRALWKGVDFMDASGFNVPQELKDEPWIGNLKLADPLVHDMLSGGTSAFASKLPFIHVRPLSDAPEELDRTDHMQELLRWHYELMNRRSKKPAHWKIVESAMKYSAVKLQTKYLPYEVKRLKLSAERRKELLSRGAFNWPVHHPSNVYETWSDDDLERVLLTYSRTVAELEQEFGKDNKGVRKLLDKFNDDKNDAGRFETYATFFDYTDRKDRVIWCVYTGSNMEANPEGDLIELLREEHKMDFINWVVVDYDSPIMKGIYDSGIYDVFNIVRTIEYAKHVSGAAHSNYDIATPNPDNPNIVVPNDPNNPMIHDTMTTVKSLPPPQIDPGLRVTINETAGALTRSGKTRALIGVEEYIGSQVPNSSINSAQGAAVAQLSMPAMVIERAEEEALHQMCKWIKQSDEPLVGFRGKASKGYQPGEQIMLRAFKEGLPAEAPNNEVYFDPSLYYIDVALRPATIEDEQGQTNLAIQQVANLMVPFKKGMEMLGYENTDALMQERSKEDFVQAYKSAKIMEIQARGEATKIIADAQAQAQAIIGAAQLQAQPQEGAPQAMGAEGATAEMNAGPAFENLGGQGFNPAAGGQTPYDVVPQENRTTINGEDQL